MSNRPARRERPPRQVDRHRQPAAGRRDEAVQWLPEDVSVGGPRGSEPNGATRVPLVILSVSAVICGVLHAMWVLFPLLDAQATANLMGTPLDPQYQVRNLAVMAIIAVPVLGIGSPLWAWHSRGHAAIGEVLAGSIALVLALSDIGGGTSGWIPGGFLIPIGLLTVLLREPGATPRRPDTVAGSLPD